MNDMSSVIVPKSDQINADDLITGPITITIREVQIRGGQEQPVSIYFDGSDKAYRPCKSMSRVLVQGWGPDANKYVGRSLTLYRDPTVKWAGMEVGGIRISHMSHIDGEKLMMLTATKGSRKPHKVQPLVVSGAQSAGSQPSADERGWADKFIANVNRAPDSGKLEAYVSGKATLLEELSGKLPELHAECEAAVSAKRASFAPAETFADDDDEDPFGLPPLPPKDEPTADLDDATADWRSKADEFLGSIRNAKRMSYIEAVADDYREVMGQMPKALCNQVEAALAAKKAELEGMGK